MEEYKSKFQNESNAKILKNLGLKVPNFNRKYIVQEDEEDMERKDWKLKNQKRIRVTFDLANKIEEMQKELQLLERLGENLSLGELRYAESLAEMPKKRESILSENHEEFLDHLNINALLKLEHLLGKVELYMKTISNGKNQPLFLSIEVDDEYMDSFIYGFVKSNWDFAQVMTENKEDMKLNSYPYTSNVEIYKFSTHSYEVFHNLIASFSSFDPDSLIEWHYLELDNVKSSEKVHIPKHQIDRLEAFDLCYKVYEQWGSIDVPFRIVSKKILFGWHKKSGLSHAFELSQMKASEKEVVIFKSKKAYLNGKVYDSPHNDDSNEKKRKRPRISGDDKPKKLYFNAKVEFVYTKNVYPYTKVGRLQIRFKVVTAFNGIVFDKKEEN
jgi:hypothetical protein